MSRRLRIAALLSVTLHAVLLAASWLFMREVPVLLEPVDKQAAVELVMVEQQGAGKTEAQSPSPAGQPDQAAQVAQPQPQAESSEAPDQAPPAAPAPIEQAEPLPSPPLPPAPPQETAAQPLPTPPPAKLEMAIAPQPLVFNLGGTDSDSNAIAEGKNIIPAAPDKKYRNRPPPYPNEAVLRGEQGAVIVVVHVSPLGLADGVEVVESSGHASLDRAAMQAVQAWRFVPAVRDGLPVAFDMPMRFVFAFN